jgi:hypothetical protein
LSPQPRPHISAALAHLRFGVMACALAVGIALVARVALWGTIHYTDARLDHAAALSQAEAEEEPAALRVVHARPADPSTARSALLQPPALAEVNRVPGETDAVMRRAWAVVQGVGVIGAAVLMVLLLQGVVIAGGGQVPGVEKAVTASTAALVVLALCLPLSRLVPGLPFDGLFVSYDEILGSSERYRARAAGGSGGPGALGFFGWHLLMPGAVLAMLALIVARFRAGVEAGIIITAPSELDEALEREIRATRTGRLAMPRAVGALNSALGDAPAGAPHGPAHPNSAPAPHAPQPNAGHAMPIEPVRIAPPAFRSPGDPPALSRNPGDSTKRPI